MVITDEMVQRGVRRAMELALLPRVGQIEDIATNDELMREILQAALDIDPDEQAPPVEKRGK